jgi:hypothetical protein
MAFEIPEYLEHAPENLRPEIREFFESVVNGGNYDSPARTLLVRYCALLNQLADVTEERIEKKIPYTFNDRHGLPRPHPLVKLELSINNELTKVFRMLGWDLAPPAQMDLFGGGRDGRAR